MLLKTMDKDKKKKFKEKIEDLKSMLEEQNRQSYNLFLKPNQDVIDKINLTLKNQYDPRKLVDLFEKRQKRMEEVFREIRNHYKEVK